MAQRPSNVRVKDNSAQLESGLRLLTETRLYVGFPEEPAQREGEPINNPSLAYIHQNGAPEANIPARPFLDLGVEQGRPRIEKQMEKAGEAALGGDENKFNEKLERAGLIGQSAVQNYLRTGTFEPLSERTLAARRSKGRTGTKPLIDTAALLQAVKYVILRKKEA